MAKHYDGSCQQYNVTCEQDIMIRARDGVGLATDIYFPALENHRIDDKLPIVLERTPYNKRSPVNVTHGKYFARRGYVCAIQDVRGRFKSEAQWYPFAKEAPDGYDTVEWLAAQPWSNGKVGTMGQSYCGSDQGALATLSPPHLCTMIVAVGASNYYDSSMRHNGALEQRFLLYIFLMAITSKEAQADPGLHEGLTKVFNEQIRSMVDQFPLRRGTTILHRLPSYEQWAIDILTHGDYDEYWRQRGYAIADYYEQHADVPTLYWGGWYDSYARNTCESFTRLRAMKKSRQYLLMGPWTHGQYEVTYAGDVDFGTESHVDHNGTRLAWFDHHLKGMHTEISDWRNVRMFTMGTGDQRKIKHDNVGRLNHGGIWRDADDWPLPETQYVRYYLHSDASLSPDLPSDTEPVVTTFSFDPRDPVPTIGGGISAADEVMRPGAFDQRGRSDFHGCQDTLPLNVRADVVSFQTPPLTQDTEVTGPIEMHLWASSSALDTDFTAKLLDVFQPSDDYPEGLAMNITDSIIRARYRNDRKKAELMTPGQVYEFTFELYPTSNVFRCGHHIRLDVSSSNWPRFDVNPNTGGPLGVERSYRIAHQTIFHESDHSSYIILPLLNRRGGC